MTINLKWVKYEGEVPRVAGLGPHSVHLAAWRTCILFCGPHSFLLRLGVRFFFRWVKFCKKEKKWKKGTPTDKTDSCSRFTGSPLEHFSFLGGGKKKEIENRSLNWWQANYALQTFFKKKILLDGNVYKSDFCILKVATGIDQRSLGRGCHRRIRSLWCTEIICFASNGGLSTYKRRPMAERSL